MRIEPEGSPDSSVSIITQIAVQIGQDRVTFESGSSPNGAEASRAQVVWVDGAPVNISASNPVFTLPGGTVTEVSINEYRVVWNTGEEVTVDPFGDGMGLSVTLAPTDIPGSVQGLFGSYSGQASAFELPDGTVLQQPLTQDEFYQDFANAWRVTDSTSLFDYGAGENTETFTNPQYPREILTLADFPADLVSAAAALAAAAGITDPALAAAAEFDYISMGDPTIFAEDAEVDGGLMTASPAIITQPAAPPPNIGVTAQNSTLVESSGATTPVVFKVELTGTATLATVVDYAVVPGGTLGVPGQPFFSSADLDGVIPSGSVAIAAGQLQTTITIDLPNNALGTAPEKWLQVAIQSTNGDQIFAPAAETEIVSNTPVAGNPAEPVIELITGATPLLTENGATLALFDNHYTLDLGQVLANESLPALQFAVDNAATAPADDLRSEISSYSGAGFEVSGSQPPGTIAAGSGYQDLYIQPETGTLGAQSETLTLASQDVNDTGYVADLPDLTLTVTDTVIAPAQAMLSTHTVTFAGVRVGTTESQTIGVSNIAAAGAAELDIMLTPDSNSTASGAVFLLAPGASDNTGLSVGLATGQGGLQSGTVTVEVFSDLGNNVMDPALPSPTIVVTGAVYREATAGVTLTDPILHVGDPDTEALTVTNTDPADGYSENLIAALTGARGAFSPVAEEPTGEIAAGDSDDSTLSVSFSTAQAGTVNGDVTLGLTSDGGTGLGSIDGFGSIALAAATFSLTATIDNYATAQVIQVTGVPVLIRQGDTYTLDLGQAYLGANPVTIELGVENAAAAIADLLEGGFTWGGDPEIALTGFANFASLAAGQGHDGLNVILNTDTAGVFTQQITLYGTGYNASGYNGALVPEVIDVSGTVVAAASYAPAVATLNTVGTVILPDQRIGGAPLSTKLSITNNATPPSEKLDVTVGSSSGAVSATGTISLLRAGQTDTTGIAVSVSTGSAGVQSGSVTLLDSTDGSGTDGNAPASVGTTTVAVSGDVYREASGTAYTPLDFNAHSGQAVPVFITVGNTALADGFSEDLVGTVLATSSGIVAPGATTGDIQAGATGTLSLDATSYYPGVYTGSVILELSSDGGPVDGLGTVDLGQQTIEVTGTVYNYAVAEIVEVSGNRRLVADGAGYALNLGQVGLGAAPVAVDLGVANAAAAVADLLEGDFTESGDPEIALSGFNAFSGVAAGYLQPGLDITLDTGTTGIFSQQITLFATGYDPSGFVGALTPEVITVTGTVAGNLAVANVTSPASLTLANQRVDTTPLTDTLSITNNATAPAEALDVSIASDSGAAISSGSITLLGAGDTNASAIAVGVSTSAAGVQTGSVTLNEVSDGANTDHAGTTPIGTETITVTGNVYRTAEASITQPVGFVTHAGQAATVLITVGNTAVAGGFSEDLVSGVVDGSASTGVTALNTTTGDIVAGAIGTIGLQVLPAAVGPFTGSISLDMTSDGAQIDGLGTVDLGLQTLAVSGTVDNYASAAITDLSGGSSTDVTNGTIDLAPIAMGSSPVDIHLAVLNNATGPADLLTGSFAISADPAFSNSGFQPIVAGLGAGETDALPMVSLSTNQAGTFSETITLDASGSNASGYSGALTPETLTIIGTIVAPVQSSGTAGAAGGADSAGGSGGSDTAAADTAGLADNTADAQGGAGGAGGSPIHSYNVAGAGGTGGAAAATATSDVNNPSVAANATASADGGDGGASGAPGAGHGNVGGAGGSATGMATATNSDGAAVATALSSGGDGGDASGSMENSGAGGVAGGTTAYAQGTTSATATVIQTGGNGGAGLDGAKGGSGAASNLVNAVSGETDGGTLTLEQDAVGGNGGASGSSVAGSGGAARSILMFDDSTNATQSADIDGTATATGGNAAAGTLFSPAGGGAAVTAELTGAGDVTATGVATGGNGGNGAQSIGGAAGATVTSVAGATATASATATGGMSATNSIGGGVVGAAAKPTVAVATGQVATATATSTGGTGGAAVGSGNGAGNGGVASGTSATATGTSAATASATQIGGQGGAGSAGASGGAGGLSTLSNAVSGSTDDGALVLAELAQGGAGGASDTGPGGAGGFATAALSFDDTKQPTQSASIQATVTGIGGAGGNSAGIGGNGGGALDSATLTGTGSVSLDVTADGGNAGTDGAAGGSASATSTASGTQVGSTATANGGVGKLGGGQANANATANGGSGTVIAKSQTGLAPGSLIISATGYAAASVGGYANAAAVAAIGTGTIYVVGWDAVAVVTAVPLAATVDNLLAAQPSIATTLGANATEFAIGELGGGHSGTGTATQTSVAMVDVTLDTLLLAAQQDLIISLFRPIWTGSNGVTGVNFNLTANGTTLVTESFSSAPAAGAWFSDHAVNLGPLAAAASVDLHLALSVTTKAAGSSFDAGFLLDGKPV
jgi:hypothetical protein